MSRLESLYIPKEALELVVDEGDHQPISLKEYLDAYMEQGSPVTVLMKRILLTSISS